MDYYLLLGRLPALPNTQNPMEIETVESESLFGGLMSDLGRIAGGFFESVSTILVIVFLFGIIFMLLAFLLKNGQWQKFAQGTMLGSFVSLILIKGYPILVYSVRSSEDFWSLFSESSSLLTYTSLFIGLISIAVSYLFKFGYRLIEHPDYYRWSKNLFGAAVVMMVFSILVPYVFPMV